MPALRFKAKGMTKYGKRHQPGVMNRTETEYAEILEERKQRGEIIGWWFESIKLKLADLCFFTTDFQVLLADGSMELVDVKGGGPIDNASVVKVKVAAEQYFMFKFVVEQKLAKKHVEKNGGPWKRIEY